VLNIRSLEAGDRQTVWVFMGPNIRSGVAYPYAMDLTLEQAYYTCVEVAEATLGS